MTQPTPVRCPAIEHPDIALADPAGLGPLLGRLVSTRPVEADEAFELGTLRADGRVDLCKQGLGSRGAARLMPAAAASPHAVHVLLGTNAIGDEGARTVAGELGAGHGLRTLYLGCNRIGPDGAAAMSNLMVLIHRGLSIAGGTSEIKRNQIGERILGLPRDPLIS